MRGGALWVEDRASGSVHWTSIDRRPRASIGPSRRKFYPSHVDASSPAGGVRPTGHQTRAKHARAKKIAIFFRPKRSPILLFAASWRHLALQLARKSDLVDYICSTDHPNFYVDRCSQYTPSEKKQKKQRRTIGVSPRDARLEGGAGTRASGDSRARPQHESPRRWTQRMPSFGGSSRTSPVRPALGTRAPDLNLAPPRVRRGSSRLPPVKRH